VTKYHLIGTHGREKVADAQRQSFFYERVDDPVSVPAFGNKASSLEYSKVARDRGGTDLEPIDDLAGRQLTALQVLQDLTSGRIGQSFEDSGLCGDIAHVLILAHELNSDGPQTSTRNDPVLGGDGRRAHRGQREVVSSQPVPSDGLVIAPGFDRDDVVGLPE
jgi:hypothetical protein